jgi:hypothetical protein
MGGKMAYTLSFNNGCGFILLELHGKLTRVEIDEALKEILAIRRQKHVDRILCDQRRLQIPPNDLVIFETAKRFAGGPYTGMKLAIVRNSIPERHFFKTVALNRSGIVKIFDEEGKAIQWLHSG